MNKESVISNVPVHQTKKDRSILKAIGSVLFAIIASAHHWLHMLLLALGLTTLGAGLFSLSPAIKIILLLISLAVSFWFIKVARRKWNHDRPAAWVYLISSIISIVIVAAAIPQTVSGLIGSEQQQDINNTDTNNTDTNNTDTNNTDMNSTDMEGHSDM